MMEFYRLLYKCCFLPGQAGILRCHPDLAGRLADAGDLTDESKLEQKAAGLDTLTSQEKTTLRQSNAEYVLFSQWAVHSVEEKIEK